MSAASSPLRLLGLGNPLLDLTLFEADRLIAKYDLPENNQLLASKKHQPLFAEVKASTPMLLPGGATQNSIRVAQWLLQTPGSTAFIGAIGDDHEGKLLEKVARECGIRVAYQLRPGENTGKCVALITGENRTLVTDLGAAVHLDVDVTAHPNMATLLQEARMIYVGGYLWSSSPTNVVAAAKFAANNDRPLAVNLHAEFLCSFFASAEYGVLPMVDYIFGNEREALALAHCLAKSNFPFAADFQRFESEQDPTTEVLGSVAEALAVLPHTNGKRGQRRVVFTAGREPLVFVDGHETTPKVVQVPIVAVPKEKIKDTNGCGDAFVGGFLAQICMGASMLSAVKCGMYASRTVIQNYGCTFPPQPDFHE